MNIIERSEIDTLKWDALVSKSGKGIQSYSWWLDQISDHWCIYADDSYTKGIALPFTVKAGVKVLYIPIFSEYLEVIGEFSIERLSEIILAEFKVIECGFDRALLLGEAESHKTQVLKAEQPYKKLAKRMLKKAHAGGLEVKFIDDIEEVFSIIEQELIGKVQSINMTTLNRLKQAVTEARSHHLIKVVGVYSSNQLEGGLILLENNFQVYYLKGSCSKEIKEMGGMYAAMDFSIRYASDRNKEFDFGGSRVEGVRKFNLQFGSEDIHRPYYSINNAPVWFKLTKQIKKMITRS